MTRRHRGPGPASPVYRGSAQWVPSEGLSLAKQLDSVVFPLTVVGVHQTENGGGVISAPVKLALPALHSFGASVLFMAAPVGGYAVAITTVQASTETAPSMQPNRQLVSAILVLALLSLLCPDPPDVRLASVEIAKFGRTVRLAHVEKSLSS